MKNVSFLFIILFSMTNLNAEGFLKYIPAQSEVRAFCLSNLDDPNTKEIIKGFNLANSLSEDLSKEVLVKLLDKTINDIAFELDKLQHLKKQEYLSRVGFDINSQKDIDNLQFYNLVCGMLHVYKENEKKYKILSRLEDLKTRVKESKESCLSLVDEVNLGSLENSLHFIKEHLLLNFAISESFNTALENILKIIDQKSHEQERTWIRDGLENAFLKMRPENCFTIKEKIKEKAEKALCMVFWSVDNFFRFFERFNF